MDLRKETSGYGHIWTIPSISRFTTGCEFAYQQIVILILFVLQLSDLSFQIKLDFNIVAETWTHFYQSGFSYRKKLLLVYQKKYRLLYLTVVFAVMQCFLFNSNILLFSYAEIVSEKAEILFRSLPALLPTRPISARSNNARPVHQKDSADLFLQIFPVC